MRFASPFPVPPIAVSSSATWIPSPPFASWPVPSAVVPMRLPAIVLPVAPAPVTSIPSPWLPEMRFPRAVSPVAPARKPIPTSFDASVVPVASVPT